MKSVLKYNIIDLSRPFGLAVKIVIIITVIIVSNVAIFMKSAIYILGLVLGVSQSSNCVVTPNGDTERQTQSCVSFVLLLRILEVSRLCRAHKNNVSYCTFPLLMQASNKGGSKVSIRRYFVKAST